MACVGLCAQVDKLTQELDNAKMLADGFEKEKDFYYCKVRAGTSPPAPVRAVPP